MVSDFVWSLTHGTVSKLEASQFTGMYWQSWSRQSDPIFRLGNSKGGSSFFPLKWSIARVQWANVKEDEVVAVIATKEHAVVVVEVEGEEEREALDGMLEVPGQ